MLWFNKWINFLFTFPFCFSIQNFFWKTWEIYDGKTQHRTNNKVVQFYCEKVRALWPEILRKVMENALDRAHKVEANIGLHLKDIIFRT